MLQSVETSGVDLVALASGNQTKLYYDFNATLGENSTESEENDIISFQPGDVVGCYIPAHANPPGVVFRNFTVEDEGGMNLMLFSTTRLNCEVSVCDESTVMLRSVFPQIFPHYTGYGML